MTKRPAAASSTIGPRCAVTITSLSTTTTIPDLWAEGAMGLNRVGFVALVRLNEMRVTCSSQMPALVDGEAAVQDDQGIPVAGQAE
ncbi:MAG: hypothetical protein ACRDH8_12790 [Actinomycetota bacterium]